MKLSKSLDVKSKLQKENALLKFAILVFGVATVIANGYAYKTRTEVRTVITPSHFSKPFEVSDKWMDDNGLRQYTKDVVVMLLNYTPKTATKNFSNFENFLLPRDYSAAHEKLQYELTQIQRLKIVSTFVDEEIKIDRNTKTISIRGLRRKDSHGREIINAQEEWVIKYRISNGNFYVADFNKNER